MVYNNITEKMMVVFRNGDVKSFDMSNDEYMDILKTGNFNFLDNNV